MANAASKPPAARPSLRREVWVALAVILLGVLLRVPRMHQSLWLDEMTTLSDYVLQPWSKVLAAGAGQYVPNNHVLHTALAKLAYTGLTGGRDDIVNGGAPAEAVLRLPALAAGVLLPVALAWPLRRAAPLAALAVAVVAAVHPWLVALGTDARGYTLMLLLGVVATHLLPTDAPSLRRMVAYALAVAGAVYTIPLAVLLLPAHGVAVALTRRSAWRRWVVGAALAVLIDTALYLPMVGGLVSYYRNPYAAAQDYRYFVDSLPRHALAGQRLPRQHVDPARPAGHDHPPDPAGSAVFWALPVWVLIVGTALAWPRFPGARPLLATLATASVIGVLLPLALPSATEVRFVTWAAPWFCLAAVLLLAAVADVVPARAAPAGVPDVHPGLRRAAWRAMAGVAAAVLLGLMVWWDVHLLPNQQVREAVALANRLAPRDGPIAIAYIGAYETAALYGSAAPAHTLLPAGDADDFAQVEAEARLENGRLPWVVVLFEQIARDRSAADPGTAGLWHALSTRYRLVARLDGRVMPVGVYAPLGGPATAPAVAVGRGGTDN